MSEMSEQLNLTPPQQPQQPPPARDTQIMIAAAVSAILVAIAVVVLIVLAIISQTDNNAQAIGDSVTGPYNTLGRPVPIASTIFELLPTNVGDFSLVEVNGLLDAGYTARYARGDQTVEIAGRQAVSVPAAQYAVEMIRQERGPASQAERIIPSDYSKSYYLDVQPNDVCFAWSRDRWFFDVRTSSLDVLTAFMTEFPY